MARITNELLLEPLERIQEWSGNSEDAQRTPFRELQAHQELVPGALSARHTCEARTASIVHRLDRIEARLELRESD